MYTLSEINSIVKGTLSGIGEMPYSFFVTDSRQVIHTEEVLFFALVSERNKGVKAFVVSNKEFIRNNSFIYFSE
ncbi:MAG: hypothetical protein IPJ60_13480 [Sphingobacteriaceae bacterium]|nr:hypothetical protein [Sphingobacteriaceae bacterium]